MEVTTSDLATLANGGVNPLTGERALSRLCARDVLTVTSSCGMYDFAGEWAYDVGIPAKSGVAGGIILAIPESFGGAVFSPGLDVHGNSVRGVNVCRDLSQRFGLHEYGDPNAEYFGLTASGGAAWAGRPADSACVAPPWGLPLTEPKGLPLEMRGLLIESGLESAHRRATERPQIVGSESWTAAPRPNWRSFGGRDRGRNQGSHGRECQGHA